MSEQFVTAEGTVIVHWTDLLGSPDVVPVTVIVYGPGEGLRGKLIDVLDWQELLGTQEPGERLAEGPMGEKELERETD